MRGRSATRDNLRARWVPAILLFVSGAASLIYQVIWIKQLSLVVGIDVQAMTVGVSAFFIGLAAGNTLFGRIADRVASNVAHRSTHPSPHQLTRQLTCDPDAEPRADGVLSRLWLLYGMLEAGIAVMGPVTTHALPQSAWLFAVLQQHAAALAWCLPVALVGIPACLMGGTLPVMLRVTLSSSAGTLASTQDDKPTEGLGRLSGVLYAANTAGATIGTLAAGFVLIHQFGVSGAAWFAAALNVAAAAAACGASRIFRSRLVPGDRVLSVGRVSVPVEFHAPSEPNAPADPDHSAHTPNASLIRAAWLYAIAGGVAMGYEVVWAQAMAPLISTRAFAFTVVLATCLASMAIGSALAQRFVGRIHDPWRAFGFLVAFAGLISMLGLAGIGPFLMDIQAGVRAWVLATWGSMSLAMCVGFLVVALWLAAAPTLLLGAAMPFLTESGASHRRPAGDVGLLVAANTAGGVAGTCTSGFALIPALGVVRTLGLLACMAALTGLVAAWQGWPAVRSQARSEAWSDTRSRGQFQGAKHQFAGLFIGLAFVLTGALVVTTPADHLARVLIGVHGGTLISYEESAGGSVAVVEQRSQTQDFRRLYIQGVSNSGDALTSLRYMRLQTLLPLIVHTGEARSVLVIGAGTGITAGATLVWPGLEHRVVAELLPAVIRGIPEFHGNFDMGHDKRIEVRLRDGRRELLSREEQYDLITLEPPPPSAAGVVNLYSSDFYRIAASRLREHGIVAQWLPLSTQNEADTRSLIASFIQTFPYASLWTTELHEMMLIGSNEPIELDWPTIVHRMSDPQVASALHDVGVASPEAMLATWVTDQSGLAYYVADASPVTDDDPRIEYAPWVRRDAFASTLTHVLALRGPPPLSNASSTQRLAVDRETTTLHTFYRAALDAYRGDRDAWAADMDEVMQADGTNPYYRWFNAR